MPNNVRFLATSDMPPKTRLISAALFAALTLAMASPASSQDVISWGLPDEASQALGIDRYRMGCSAEPKICTGRAAKGFANSNSSVSLSFGTRETLKAAAARAEIYGKFANANRYVDEISIDDFVSFLRGMPAGTDPATLENLIKAAKPSGSQARFGITVYEDQLDELTHSPMLTKDAKAAVDRVAIYLHFRESVTDYQATVEKVRQLFPNAKLYGGVYHYTRVGRLSCKQGAKALCSNAQEIDLFERALALQKDMMAKGKLDGLELFPGRLAHIRDWSVWQRADTCSQRVGTNTDCIESSAVMVESVKRALKHLPLKQ